MAKRKRRVCDYDWGSMAVPLGAAATKLAARRKISRGHALDALIVVKLDVVSRCTFLWAKEPVIDVLFDVAGGVDAMRPPRIDEIGGGPESGQQWYLTWLACELYRVRLLRGCYKAVEMADELIAIASRAILWSEGAPSQPDREHSVKLWLALTGTIPPGTLQPLSRHDVARVGGHRLDGVTLRG